MNVDMLTCHVLSGRSQNVPGHITPQLNQSHIALQVQLMLYTQA